MLGAITVSEPISALPADPEAGRQYLQHTSPVLQRGTSHSMHLNQVLLRCADDALQSVPS